MDFAFCSEGDKVCGCSGLYWQCTPDSQACHPESSVPCSHTRVTLEVANSIVLFNGVFFSMIRQVRQTLR